MVPLEFISGTFIICITVALKYSLFNRYQLKSGNWVRKNFSFDIYKFYAHQLLTFPLLWKSNNTIYRHRLSVNPWFISYIPAGQGPGMYLLPCCLIRSLHLPSSIIYVQLSDLWYSRTPPAQLILGIQVRSSIFHSNLGHGGPLSLGFLVMIMGPLWCLSDKGVTWVLSDNTVSW
jgi:hypothetical protein